MSDIRNPEHAVVIERSFDAPLSLIWQMWTEPEHFAAWYGPDGATVSVAQMDVRVGGSRRIRMEVTTPNGPMEMWFAGVHLEVMEPQRLVYTEAMADADGNVTAAEGHPEITEVRVELEAIGDRTKMVMTHAGIPSDSPGAAGWGMALDKLAARVAVVS